MTEVDFDFYSTAAQVIPLIFVALAFEFRGQGGQFLPRELQGDTPAAEASDGTGRGILLWAAVYTFVMTLVLATGEVVALLVIANDTVWWGSRLIVASSLVIGGLGIVGPIGLQQYNTWTRVRRLQR